MGRLESLSNNENITQIASFISKIQSNEDLNIMKQVKEESVFIEYVKELKSKSATDQKVTQSEDQKEYITQFDDKKNPKQKNIKKISKNIGKKKSVFISKSCGRGVRPPHCPLTKPDQNALRRKEESKRELRMREKSEMGGFIKR